MTTFSFKWLVSIYEHKYCRYAYKKVVHIYTPWEVGALLTAMSSAVGASLPCSGKPG